MDSKQSARRPIEPANTDKDDEAQPAGRIVHDDRGNAVWKGASADSTSTMLKRLELPGLKVEGQEEAPPPVSHAPTPQAKPAQPQKPAQPPDVSHGYNPYDQHHAIRKPTTPKGPVKRKPESPR